METVIHDNTSNISTRDNKGYHEVKESLINDNPLDFFTCEITKFYKEKGEYQFMDEGDINLISTKVNALNDEIKNRFGNFEILCTYILRNNIVKLVVSGVLNLFTNDVIPISDWNDYWEKLKSKEIPEILRLKFNHEEKK